MPWGIYNRVHFKKVEVNHGADDDEEVGGHGHGHGSHGHGHGEHVHVLKRRE